jgi:hypothetical protein
MAFSITEDIRSITDLKRNTNGEKIGSLEDRVGKLVSS